MIGAARGDLVLSVPTANRLQGFCFLAPSCV